ncbi:hypothetical protein ACFOW4_22715 [Micromonospora sp. GCM10011542]|uniref:hypothetical protein n=1 Tax=Micromonospora sp. GCM10011542 TaxID=3317337 RepID=UPI00361054DC
MSVIPGRPDNPTGHPTRPYEVRRDEMEEAVRETLSRRVAVARPLVADPAGQAIRRAKRIRRRRTAAGLALAATATVVVSAGMVQLDGDSGRPATPTVVIGDPYASGRPVPTASVAGPEPVPSARAAVDLIVGTTLTGADGGRLDLPGVGRAERAHQLPDQSGWLVVGAPAAAGRSLWVVQRDGLVQVLLAGAAAITVATDGRQVAWRDGPDLLVAGVVGTQLIGPVRTPVPATAVPVGFVGDSVLVRIDRTNPGYVLWRPGAGNLRSGTDRGTLNVYGSLPDGRLIGQVMAGTPPRPCLAVLDPTRNLRPQRTGCGALLSQDGAGGVSADGRWLLANGRAGQAESALLIDLNRLGPDTPVVPAGPTVTGAVAWPTGSDAAYVDAAGGLVRVAVDRVLAGEPASAVPVAGAGQGQRPVVVTGP